MLALVSILALPAFVAACGSGTGKLGTTATYKFNVAPAVRYTFADTLEFGQMGEAYAKSAANRDAMNVILEVLRQDGISSDGVKVEVNFAPPKVNLVEKCAAADTYQIVGETVLYKCTGADAKVLYFVADSIKVTTTQAIYESQWKTLGSQIVDTMEQEKNVVFDPSSITVDVN